MKNILDLWPYAPTPVRILRWAVVTDPTDDGMIVVGFKVQGKVGPLRHIVHTVLKVDPSSLDIQDNAEFHYEDGSIARGPIQQSMITDLAKTIVAEHRKTALESR